MKKVILAFGLLLSSSALLAQCNCFEKGDFQTRFGFNLGMNLSNVYAKDMPNQSYTEGGFGFRLGILADLQFAELVSLSPRAELSFNSASITLPDQGGIIEPGKYRLMQNSLEFSPLIKVRVRNENLMPYFVVGPNIKVPIRYNEDNTPFRTNSDVALDLGFGIERSFGRVFSSFELKYSLGLMDINQHPDVGSAKLHNISLIWNFAR